MEGVGAGSDRVYSSVTHTLGANLENLYLTGAAASNGTGNVVNNIIAGNSGNNVLDGGVGNDVINGAAGDDTVIYDAADTNVQGGIGTDTLRMTGAATALDLTLIPDNRYRDFEIIDLTGTGNNSLTLALNDVLALSSTTDILRVDGNVGDQLTATDSGSWVAGADQVIGANTYHTYTQGAATLLFDIDIFSNL